MGNPRGTRIPRTIAPPMPVVEPLPGNRCPRCEGKLYSTWYGEESCYTCGYETPTPAPVMPTREELQALQPNYASVHTPKPPKPPRAWTRRQWDSFIKRIVAEWRLCRMLNAVTMLRANGMRAKDAAALFGTHPGSIRRSAARLGLTREHPC